MIKHGDVGGSRMSNKERRSKSNSDYDNSTFVDINSTVLIRGSSKTIRKT